MTDCGQLGMPITSLNISFQRETMDNKEVMTFVCEQEDPQLACRNLAREVTNRCKLKRVKADNTTIIVVVFNSLPQPE